MSRSRRRRRPALLVMALLLALLAWRTVQHPAATARADLPSVSVPAAAADSLIVEPDQGLTPVYALLGGARHTLDLTMYELADPTAESLLAASAARGVRVRVILDGRLQRSHNTSAYDYLRSRGVSVAWASSRYFVTHEKAFVVDGSVAVVMSLNLTSRYYATTRDVAVVDRDPGDVRAVESVFDADFHDRRTGTPAADDLAWSPGQAAADFVALIRSARRSVLLESEELASDAVVGALADAARRGVEVEVVMTYQAGWAAAFDRVTAAGATVRVLHGETPRYIHAKILAIDAGTPAARVLVGSQNISDASLQRDRELGIVLLQPALVRRLVQTVAADGREGTPWR